MKALLLLLLTAFAASAKVVVYSFTGAEQFTGSGVEVTIRSSGTLVVDLISDTAVRLSKSRINGIKRLKVSDEFGIFGWRARGPQGSTRTMFVSGGATNGPFGYVEGCVHFSGKNAFLDIGWFEVEMPRSFKGAGYTVGSEGGFYAYAMSSLSANHAFASKATIEANNAAERIEQVVERFRQLYVSQGYAE